MSFKWKGKHETLRWNFCYSILYKNGLIVDFLFWITLYICPRVLLMFSRISLDWSNARSFRIHIFLPRWFLPYPFSPLPLFISFFLSFCLFCLLPSLSYEVYDRVLSPLYLPLYQENRFSNSHCFRTTLAMERWPFFFTARQV